MPNHYFQFKQFTIQQDKCAMKVTTDGCLFGAIVAAELQNNATGRLLDIGAGTGLLSLMVAQENEKVIVDAVELDDAAAEQSKENITASPWSGRMNVFNQDILDYQPAVLYDVIISNPPFYEQQLTSPNTGKQLAHHSSGLSLQQLFQQVLMLLKQKGRFYVLLPFYRLNEVILFAKEKELFVEKQWLIKQTLKHSSFRTVLCFSRKEKETQTPIEIAIRDEQAQYTAAFTKLLQPFYLHL